MFEFKLSLNLNGMNNKIFYSIITMFPCHYLNQK